MLRKYQLDPSHVMEYKPLELQEDMMYTEQPIQMLDKKKKQVLWTKAILLVKVLCICNSQEETT